MNQLSLTRPDEGWEQAVWDYRQEFIAHGDSLDGAAGLRQAEDYSGWLQALRDNERPETVRPGFVDASTLLAVRQPDGHLVGMVDIRHRLNDFLLQFGGHIGYSVRAGERRKGYATEMLRLALDKCRGLGLKRVLVTCDQKNTASARTIRANGGILENEVPEGEEITQRYWIEV